MSSLIVRVALDSPLPTLFDYRWPAGWPAPVAGCIVSVPFGRRRVTGVIFSHVAYSEVPEARLKDVEAVYSGLPPLGKDWLALTAFAADYYQRPVGEVAVPAIPPAVRSPERWQRIDAAVHRHTLSPAGRQALPAALPARAAGQRRLAEALAAPAGITMAEARAAFASASGVLRDWQDAGWVEAIDGARSAQGDAAAADATFGPPHASVALGALHGLTEEQRAAVSAIDEARGFSPFLLFGITGSGKTEVYLHALATRLNADAQAQTLVLVPEINLTPQFEAAFRARFPSLQDDDIVTLHSGLAEGERARHWLAAHAGRARIVLGTRLAILAPIPHLALIIVDEEHEAAYKQQEGLRYSARDLAVWRAKHLGIPVVLGSATPSLETWAQAEAGRYKRLTLTRRAVANAALPTVTLIDLEFEKRRARTLTEGLSQPLVAALRARLERGEQSLIFLNRRGFAPVLACEACGWLAGCPRCSAYVVLHRPERAMRCHHCGWDSPVPHACPECGNIDLAPLGRGTQRIEEALGGMLPGARVLRIDADSTRRKGSAQAMLADVHAGEVDILVGTQMVAKGHDFKRVSLVGVLNADTALFSHDFRAGERLFAQLAQVSGRAGRGGVPGEVMVQTRYPSHPLYAALSRHDYPGYAAAALAERRDARLPPYVHQALLRAEARTLEAALDFLKAGARAFATLPGAEQVALYDPVPLTIVKVMHVHRAQLLLESGSRKALHVALQAWQPHLRALRGVIRWALEIDPLEI
jgi:primosomal protein N' (replication factor Y)